MKYDVQATAKQFYSPSQKRQEKKTVSRFVTALKQCRDLEHGIQLHNQLVSLGCHSNKHVAAALIIMYSNCGDMQNARAIFDKLTGPTIISWNSLILGYIQNGQSPVALNLFSTMSCEPDSVSFLAALKACSTLAARKTFDVKVCLETGSRIHEQLKQRGLGSEVTLVNGLVDMYSKCGDMQNAKQVFDEALNRNVVTWNCLMLGYVSNKDLSLALELFSSMDCKPDAVSFLAALKACGGLAAENESLKSFCLQRGRMIHKHLDINGLASQTSLQNTLLDVYSKCGCMKCAQDFFDRMTSRTVVAWNSLILGYVENGESLIALEAFDRLDPQPDSVTFVAALRACSCLDEEDKRTGLEKGMVIHQRVKELGLLSDLAVTNTLLNMYCRCGSMQRAHDLFDKSKHRNTVTWNCLILGYVENREYHLGLEVFTSLDCEPDSVTFLAGLKACSGLAKSKNSDKKLCLATGVSIHARLKKLGREPDTSLTNTLMNMYSRCGAVEQARAVFDGMNNRSVVSWTCMILGYVDSNKSELGLQLFNQMDCEPDVGAYAAGLKACIGALLENGSPGGKMFCLENGLQIHSRLRERGLDREMTVASKLLDVYARCGSLTQAREVFENMKQRDALAWTCLILGFTEQGESSEAVNLFMSMDCTPDSGVFVAVLKACKGLSSLGFGRSVNAWICKLGLEQDAKVANSLVDFYGRCGKVNSAEHVFLSNSLPDVVSWNALLAGYAAVGNVARAFEVGADMQELGVEMSGVTLTCMLTACSHGGVVEDGKRCFDGMVRRGFSPGLEHYNCMVDLFGRSNMVEEALALVYDMPFEGDKVTWTSLLEACRKWNNLDVGKVAFDALSGVMKKVM